MQSMFSSYGSIALSAALAVGAFGCISSGEESSEDAKSGNWIAGDDAKGGPSRSDTSGASPDPSGDDASDDPFTCPDGEPYDPSEGCDPPSSPKDAGSSDTEEQTADALQPKRDARRKRDTDEKTPDATPPDDPDTELVDTRPDRRRPDSGRSDTRSDTHDSPDVTIHPPRAGRRYSGPYLDGQSTVRVQSNVGVGLFWQSALMRKMHGPHRYVPNRPVLHLSRLKAPGSRGRTFVWQLPADPAPSRHFHRGLCDMIGTKACKKRNIDDSKPHFAVMKLALHQSPSGRRPSDCTFGLIYTKRSCNYGEVVAPESRALVIYAYHPFNTRSFQFFREWGVDTRLSKGYHVLLFNSTQSGGPNSPKIVAPTSRIFVFSDTSSFPRLFK